MEAIQRMGTDGGAHAGCVYDKSECVTGGNGERMAEERGATTNSASSDRGVFITLEGPDGAGKSTQALLLVERLCARGHEVIALREPGGTAISEKIRAILLDPANAEMADECELLLYEASRAQLVRQVIEPALGRGAVVVCDRYFDSTYAYQAGARGLDDGLVRRANRLGSCGVRPDLTLVLDMDPACAFSRAAADGEDRLEAEGLAFQRRVRAAYLRLSTEEPERVHVVDAAGSFDEVVARIDAELAGVLPATGEAAGRTALDSGAAGCASPEGGCVSPEGEAAR